MRDDACAWIERDRVGASALLSDESGDAQCKSGDKEYSPRLNRNAPCVNVVGTNDSMTSNATIGKTNSSGGAIGTPGRSSSGSNSDGMER